MRYPKLASIFVLLFLVLSVFGQDDYLWCDYHNYKAFYDRKEYPNNRCYKVYTHYYWKDTVRYVHKLTTPCS